MSEKDTFWFRHDSNAKDDPKCVLLIEQLGLEGYGIFWMLIEILREQKDYSYQLALIPAIARRYNTTSEKVKAVILNYGLFEIVDDKFFYSRSLTLRMESYNSLKARRSEAGKIGVNSRWSKQVAIPSVSDCDSNRIANESQTNSNRIANEYDCNTTSLRIDKNRIDKNRVDIKEELPKGSKKKSDKEEWISSLKDLGVEEQVVEDWLKIRKEKKLALTPTSLKDAIKELTSLQDTTPNDILKFTVIHGWGGCKAEWYVNEKQKENQSNQSYDRKYTPSSSRGPMSFKGIDYGESTI